MKFLFALAWKNLSRYSRRTLITAGALAVGVAVFIWMDGWLVGADLESRRNIVWYEAGSAKLMTRPYFDDLQSMPLKEVIEEPAAVEQALEGLPGVATARRVSFAGELFVSLGQDAGEGSLFVKAVALDPQTDGRVFRLEETLQEGRFLEAGQPQLLLGEWLARDLGAKVGDWVTLRARSRYGAFQTLDLQVVGILNCPNPMINQGMVFLPLEVADEALQMEGAVTEIAVSFPEWQDPAARLAGIRARLAGFPELVLADWQELAKDFLAIAEGKRAGTSMLLFLVFIIAAVGISNTMLMAVFERVREIGMMRALGMRDGAIRLAFLLEAGGIGLVGSLAGLALGAALNWVMVRWGLDLSAWVGEMQIGYRVHSVFRSAWHPQALIGALLFGVLASMLISFIPSSRALKMRITDCLRYQ
jgi:ABC-type lipoprotein release transport system permease subunit